MDAQVEPRCALSGRLNRPSATDADPTTGRATLSIDYVNRNSAANAGTRLADYLRVYVPAGARLTSISGLTDPQPARQVHELTEFAGFLDLPAGERQRVEFRYWLPPHLPARWSASGYALRVLKQPGTDAHSAASRDPAPAGFRRSPGDGPDANEPKDVSQPGSKLPRLAALGAVALLTACTVTGPESQASPTAAFRLPGTPTHLTPAAEPSVRVSGSANAAPAVAPAQSQPSVTSSPGTAPRASTDPAARQALRLPVAEDLGPNYFELFSGTVCCQPRQPS